MRVTPETIEVRVMFILVNEVSGDVSNCGEYQGNRRESKENLCENFERDDQFVINIQHGRILSKPI